MLVQSKVDVWKSRCFNLWCNGSLGGLEAMINLGPTVADPEILKEEDKEKRLVSDPNGGSVVISPKKYI